jgi:flagellar basal-body rod protein FlgB
MQVEGLFSKTIQILGKSVDLRVQNQNLIASNIANAETPNYIPRQLDFESQLREAVKKPAMSSGSGNGVSHPAHFPLRQIGSPGIAQVQGEVKAKPAATPGRDGNAVEMENEMGAMMQNQVLFNASAQLLAKKFEGLKSAIREGK